MIDKDRKPVAFATSKALDVRTMQQTQRASRVEKAPGYAEQMAMIRHLRREHAPVLAALAQH